MNWFKYFRLVSSKKRPLAKRTYNPLRLEALEPRDVPAVPTVTSVTPATGGLLGTSITVQYSEDVTGANQASSYRVFAADGTQVNIATVAYNSGTFTATILTSSLSVDGGPLTAGVSSLFLRGDQIVSVSTNDPLARAGELVVANTNRNLSTVSLTGSGIGAVSTLALPAQGTTAYTPTAVASGDVNADTFPDLIVASGAQNTVNVHLGNAAGGFSTLPDVTLDIPSGANPSALLLVDLNGDAKLDLAVANRGTNNVSVFLNQNSLPGQLQFAGVTNYAAGNAPVAIVAGRFNNDPHVDLIVANNTADSSNNYTVNVLTNSNVGDGTFNAAVPITVGNTTPTNLTAPSSLAVGLFNNDMLLDVVVGGSSGISLLTNTANGGTPSFNTAFTSTSAVSSVATGVIRRNAGASTLSDIVATVNDTTNGALVAFINDGLGGFRQTGNFDAGGGGVGTTGVPVALTLRDLTGDGRPEVVYTFPTSGGFVSRSPLQTGLVETTTATVSPITVTSTAHGLKDGQRVVITGVAGNTNANSTWYITNVTANTFDLVGSTGNAAYTSGGVWLALPGIITNVTKSSGNPIVVTSPNHGLRSGQQITISGVGGATNANNSFFVTVINGDSFSLSGTENLALGGTYTANTGSFALPVYPTGASGSVDLTITPVLTGQITNVTDNNAPIVITSNNHGLANGQRVIISGVQGNTAANGTFTIQNVTTNTFELVGATGNGNYTTGGTWKAPQDFSGDGIADVVIANKTNNTLSYYTGSGSNGVGDGTFLAATNLVLNNGTGVAPGSPSDDVTVGDVNGDGIPDLVSTNTTKNQVHVFLGLRGGGYASTPALSTTAGGNSRTPVSVALGDLDGDNKLDIVVASQRDSNVAIYRNTSSGTTLSFAAPTRVTVGSTPTQVILADVNGDDDLDLLVSHLGKNPGVTLRLGNGNATFQGSSKNPPDIFGFNRPTATGIAVADFNRDGNLDIAVANDGKQGGVTVVLGDGTGKFPTSNTYTVGINPTAIITADFNSDGFTDIATVSRSETTTDNVSVLLNNAGTGFQTAINTPVPTGAPLKSIQAVNVNSDAFIDLVVTSQAYVAPAKATSPPPPNATNNVHVLTGVGDGSFTNKVSDYTVDIPTNPPVSLPPPTSPPNAPPPPVTPLPSEVAVVSDPFRLLSTFNVGGTTVSVNLLRNGNFEARDLTGEQGNLTGWSTFRLSDTTSGSVGQWLPQTGSNSPLSLTSVPPPSNGKYRAMLDQENRRPFQGNNNPNNDDTYAGSHAIYQDVTIPINAASVKLSFTLYLDSAANWSDPANTPDLDYRRAEENQQVRVDIVAPNNNFLDISSSTVKLSVFQTQATDQTTRTVTFGGSGAVDLSAFKGQTIRLRVASVNNQGKLIVGLDDVRIQAVFTDGTAPQILSLNLRNPTFLSSPSTLEQSTDPTIVGQVRDNGSINNIKQITFDLGNNGFGGPDDAVITTVDANGFFSFTPTTLLPGVLTVPVRVVDQAGNVVTQNYQFILQGPSLTNWQAVGPGPINIASAGFNYSTVSGKITGLAVDPTDPSGNTIYVGSANGGVWKTSNGGKDWLALTDNVTDATGQRVNVSVGGLAMGVNASTRVIYAATGVDDNTFTSRSGIGVLRSLDDGRTWQVLGTTTANGSVNMTGARVSKIVVDPSNPAIVYVAITSWDDPSKSPMILKTTNGLAANPTWKNVLLPQNMFNPGRTSTLGAGYSTLASVTDLIVDRFNPSRVIIGLGNIAQRSADGSAGVWKSIDGGATWEQIVGGDNQAVTNGTIPSGTSVGRVTVAQGSGRVGDERFVYVLMSNPPNSTDQFNQGSYLGLFKSKDNMLNFTKVMLKEPNPGHARFAESYGDIELLGNEGGNVGALVVDPSNPNVVFVGGSRRFSSGGHDHALLRVDTGNMRDTTYSDGSSIPNDGDDIDKAAAAAAASGKYPTGTDSSGNTIGGVTYAGEGVYWYDIEQGNASAQQGRLDNSTNLRRLPPSIQRIVFDTQGRLLFGTENGLYRGVPLGFGYDFYSEYSGILDVGRNRTPFTPPGMTITELNGNLQITDLTSVAIDPSNRDRLYISASGVGSAFTPSGSSAWQTIGLTGPTVTTTTGSINLGIPNAFQMLTTSPAPDAPPGATTTLYRTWQFNGTGSLTVELSQDGGSTFIPTGDQTGISTSATAKLAGVLAINSKKAEVQGQFYDELLFGADKVYLSRTGGNVFDAISSGLSGFVSALGFSPTDGEYVAGTDTGHVYLKQAGGNFVDITGSLLTNFVGGNFRINGLTVDPRNPNTLYVMFATPNGRPSVFRTTNLHATTPTWSTVAGGLPPAASYKMVIDSRASTGALNGRMYIGTDRGVFTSVNNGTNWTPLGAGLPSAPVVDLQFNPNLDVLAAATQGRGVFTLSTARSGPAIIGVTPANPTTDGALTDIQVTFNTPVDPRTFTADSNNAPRTILTLLALNSTDFAATRIKELVQQYQHRVASPGDIQIGLSYFFVLNPDGSIAQQFDPKYNIFVNISQPQGELNYTSFLTSSNFYFVNFGGGTNATWIEQVWQDFFHRSAAGDTVATGFLNQLNAGQITRMGITQRLTGALAANGSTPGPTALTNPLNPRAAEFHTNLVASLFNKLVARNYPISNASSAEISEQVATLARGGLLRNVIARIISTTEAYQKMGNDYALPSGVVAQAVALGNLTGTTVGANTPVLDLIVAGSNNKLYLFQGKVGGGYAQNPTLILNLPGSADPAQILVADFNGDGKHDLVVANSWRTAADGDSLSVFLNTRSQVGQLSFGARADLNGGNNPIGIAVGNVDNDSNGFLDIVAANRTVNGANNYTASILVGNGDGTFATPVQIKVGDNVPNTAELVAPTGIALANVTGDTKLDLIVSGDGVTGGGVAVLTNTTATPGGTPTFSALASRLTNTPTTSVAAGNLDGDGDLDIVATSDAAAGEVLVFRNDGAATFTGSNFATGANPRQVQLADMTGDGKKDIVVVNDILGGDLSILYNTTTTAALSFASPMVYPVTGTRPAFLTTGDVNQDGLTDLAIGYHNSEFVSLIVGQQQGFLRVATDPNWLDWVFRSLAGRPFTQDELKLFAPILGDSGLAYLNGPDGIAAPLSITPTDSSNLTYTLSFAPRVLNSSYRLFIGPNTVPGLVLKDFIDQNGTYTNTGNAMNQDGDAFNGETPVGPFPSDPNQGDRFTTRVSVNTNDDGRFITALYADFQGTTATGGRLPDQAGFNNLAGTLEPARLASLGSIATTLVSSTEEVDHLITTTYQRYLRRLPGADLAPTRTAIQNGTQTIRGLVVQLLASNEYFNDPTFGGNGDNNTWMTALYRDVLPGVTAPTFPAGKTRLQVANQLVFSDAALQQTVSEYMLALLGRTPVRNSADARLDETTAYPYNAVPGTNFLTLLRTGGAAGQPTGDQRLLIALASSTEYLRLHGNSNFEWLKSIYTTVLGRPTIDTDPVTGTEFNGVLNTLLTNYTTTRESLLTTLISTREFRDRFYADYYAAFLSRTPSQAELDAQEAFYQSTVTYDANTANPPATATLTQRLELVVANIMRSNEFFPLSGPGSSNSGWLSKVYSLLLGRDADDATALAQLAYLNSKPASQIANARFSVALQVLTTTEYRQILVTNFYQTYLGRTPSQAELNNLVTAMSGTNGITQQAVLIRFLRHAEYFRHVTELP